MIVPLRDSIFSLHISSAHHWLQPGGMTAQPVVVHAPSRFDLLSAILQLRKRMCTHRVRTLAALLIVLVIVVSGAGHIVPAAVLRWLQQSFAEHEEDNTSLKTEYTHISRFCMSFAEALSPRRRRRKWSPLSPRKELPRLPSIDEVPSTIDEVSNEQKTGLTINALPDALPVEEMVGEDAVCSTVCDSNLKSVSTPPVL